MNKLITIIAAIVCVGLFPSLVQADTGLVMRCDAATAPIQAAACTGSRAWVHPQSGEYILSHPTVAADSTTISWSDAGLQFRSWISIPGSYGVMTCTKDIPAPSAIPVGGADSCAPSGDSVAKKFVAASTVSITPPVVLVNGTANLAWVAPTININDGSPLTDLKSYNVYQGASVAALIKLPVSLPSTTTSYVVTGLVAGTYYFGVAAVDAAGNEGDRGISNAVTVTKQVTPKKPGAPGSVTATITVTVP